MFVSSDSSLLTFDAGTRPQGRTAGGMAGIKLAEGAHVMAFNVVPAGKVAWTYEEGENGLTSGAGAVVLTVAGDEDALPGTENGAAKVTPLEMYPTKGRATGGVRSQRFLKGQNTLILACGAPIRCTPPHPPAPRSSFPNPTCAATVPAWTSHPPSRLSHRNAHNEAGPPFLVPPHNFSKFNAVSDNPVYYGRITRPIRSAIRPAMTSYPR